MFKLNLDRLVEDGYLPYEVVPALSTTKLINILENIDEIAGFNVQKNSKYGIYTIPKVKHVRRTLAIPHPFHQILLSKKIVEYWSEIDEYISKSPISLSKPNIGISADDVMMLVKGNRLRAVKRDITLSEIPIKRSILSVDSRFLLKADISRFFPTIYTHIIPWAVHSKEISKKNVNAKKSEKQNLWGDEIDKLVRSTQANQTMGIPIGPDTSMIISEIVGTAIDLKLLQKLKENKIKLKGFRFVDDFYLYFNDLASAQYALSMLHLILKEFELELNTEKTKIIELPITLEAEWVLELRKFQYQLDGKSSTGISSDNLISYFSKAFELSKIYSDESVLKYALTEIMDTRVDLRVWYLYESLILKASIVEPSVLPIVAEIFYGYSKEKGYSLNKKQIANTMFEIIYYHSKYHNAHEITWALWICKILNIKISAKAVKAISTIENDLVALVAMDLQSRKLISKLDTSVWERFATKDHLYSEHWLLAYEAIKKGWINPRNSSDYLDKDPFFALLKKNDVEFYDIESQVTPVQIGEGENQFVKNIRKRRKRNY
jgi:hypothetical protein